VTARNGRCCGRTGQILNASSLAGSIIPSDGSGDGINSKGIYLGVAPGNVNSLANPADLSSVNATIYLDSGQTTGIPPLWASASNPSQVSSVYVELLRPTNLLNAGSSTGQISRPIDPAQTMTATSTRFEYTGFTFGDAGKYETYYYAIDKETGAASPSKRSLIYRDKTGNHKPTAPTATEPGTDGLVPDPVTGVRSIPATTLQFQWTAGTDQDNDPLTYTLDICSDSAFSSNCKSYEEILSTTYIVEGLTAGTSYYWRVWSVDPYTRSTTASATGNFTPQSANPLLTVIRGQVINADNPSQVISSAQVTLKVPGNLDRAAVTKGDGTFEYMAVPMNASPFAFSLTVTKESASITVPVSIIPSGTSITQVIALSATATQINGTCGSSNGQSFTTVPTTNLCTSGTATTVTGNGPWNWSCQGSNGGTTATCSANLTSSSSLSTPIPWYNSATGMLYTQITNGIAVTGGGTVTTEPDLNWTVVATGDFDANGVTDYLWWNKTTGQTRLMLMQTATTILSSTLIHTEPDLNWRIITAMDINNDGRADIIWQNRSSGAVYAMTMNGSTVTGGGIITTEPDLNWRIVATSGTSLIWWHSSSGQTSLMQTNGIAAATRQLIWTEPDTTWRIVGSADMNGDSSADLIWKNSTTGAVYAMTINGSSVTGGAVVHIEPDSNWKISATTPGIIWRHATTGQVAYQATGSLATATKQVIHTEPNTNWQILGPPYWQDIIYGGTTTPTAQTGQITWRHQSDGKVSAITTNGSTITGGAQFWQETNPAWSIVGQGDFDGDGIRDLVWQNSVTGQVYIMLMSTPTAVKSGAVIYTEPDTNWKIVATGDINGDGKTDLIWWNKTTGQVSALLVNGTTIAGGGQIYTEPDTNWKIVAAADFNGNGKVELLWWNSATGQVALGQTNGTSASSANLIWYEPDTNWRIAGAGDLDGDGKADIIWHNRTTGQVYGMQTNGSSVTNGAMMYTEANTNWEIVSVGSYNGDSKADLLWWNQQTGQVYLMPMNGLSVGSGAALLYTEPDTTWRIQGETEWRDNLYGRGVTTTTK